jgi:hypothetical protein
MHSKKTLLVSSSLLAIAGTLVLSVSLFAEKPQPPVPVTATYRVDPADALRSDGGGSYAGGIAADGSRLLVSASGHPFCYYETTPFDDGGDCLEGNLLDGFFVCGAGEIAVTPQWEGFFAMINGETQPADATARIVGNDNFKYFVRFKPTDSFASDEPNCSTTVTITRIDATQWEIEGFDDDVARVLKDKRGNPNSYTNPGHYLAPFKISLSQP